MAASSESSSEVTTPREYISGHMCRSRAIRTVKPMYEIVVEGQLPAEWDEWIEGFETHVTTDGPGPSTTLIGSVTDQPALHGVLARLRDWALPIVSVRDLSYPARTSNPRPEPFGSTTKGEHAMTTTAHTAPIDDSTAVARRNLRAMLVAAAVFVGTAVLAGVGLLVVDPEAGSTTEAAFGFTAAVSGLATAVSVIAAVVYAQIRGLWSEAPNWIRLAFMAFIVIGIVRSIISWIA